MNCNYNNSKSFELKRFPNALRLNIFHPASSKSLNVLTNRRMHLQFLKSKVYLKITTLHFIIGRKWWMETVIMVTQKIDLNMETLREKDSIKCNLWCKGDFRRELWWCRAHNSLCSMGVHHRLFYNAENWKPSKFSQMWIK